MIRSIFDPKRKEELKDSIRSGDPRVFSKHKAEDRDSALAPAPDVYQSIRTTIDSLKRSVKPTRERLEEAKREYEMFLSAFIEEHGRDGVVSLVKSVREKLAGPKGRNGEFTESELIAVGLIDLSQLVTDLSKMVRTEDEFQQLMKNRGP